jgi:hypothetical protein
VKKTATAAGSSDSTRYHASWVSRVHAEHLGDLREVLALVLAFIADRCHHHHLGLDLRLDAPGRREDGASGGVGVDVERHVHPSSALFLDEGYGLGSLAPVRPVRRLVVRNLDRQTSLPADRDRFVDGFEEAIALVADVADVDAAALGRCAGDGDNLLRLGERTGYVDEARGETNGPCDHALGDVLSHLGELSLIRDPRVHSHGACADNAVRDEAGDVDGGVGGVDRVMLANGL